MHTARKLYSKAVKLHKPQSNCLLCAVQLPCVCTLFRTLEAAVLPRKVINTRVCLL